MRKHFASDADIMETDTVEICKLFKTKQAIIDKSVDSYFSRIRTTNYNDQARHKQNTFNILTTTYMLYKYWDGLNKLCMRTDKTNEANKEILSNIKQIITTNIKSTEHIITSNNILSSVFNMNPGFQQVSLDTLLDISEENNLLSNNTNKSIILHNTQLCIYGVRNKCNVSECNYAHSVDELVPCSYESCNMQNKQVNISCFHPGVNEKTLHWYECDLKYNLHNVQYIHDEYIKWANNETHRDIHPLIHLQVVDSIIVYVNTSTTCNSRELCLHNRVHNSNSMLKLRCNYAHYTRNIKRFPIGLFPCTCESHYNKEKCNRIKIVKCNINGCNGNTCKFSHYNLINVILIPDNRLNKSFPFIFSNSQ
jgi:hypothetical protein